MSARDSESGSSTYRGGSGNAGGLGNGGIGGGMGGGHRGGGAGYNGGIGSRTGLTTGKDWHGNTAFGRAGGNVQAYGTRDARSLDRAGMGPTVGSFGNFRTPTGQAMFAGSPVQGQSFYGRNMGQALSQAQRAQARQPAAVPGLLAEPVPAAVTEEIPAYTPNIFNQDYLNSIVDFRKAMWNRYGWGAAMPGPGPMTAPAPVAPTSWRNPTAFPQFASGWKNTTDNYLDGTTYPGGITYHDGDKIYRHTNADARFGIDKIARDRGF